VEPFKIRTKMILKTIFCFVSTKQCNAAFVDIMWRAFGIA